MALRTSPAFPEQEIDTRTILIVDYEKDFREYHRDSLKCAGYTCFTAASAQAASELLAATDIDLAVVDIMMPKMDGLELFQEVKQKYPQTAVLFVSDENRMDIAVSHLREGALDYLMKPLDGPTLVNAVHEALLRHGEYLENSGHQQHLEELLVHQSKALENKVREVKTLNQIVADLPAGKAPSKKRSKSTRGPKKTS